MRHDEIAVGLTHASIVIALVKSSDAASGMLTEALVPLNDSAPPNLPAASAWR